MSRLLRPSKLTYQPFFKLRPAPDGWYVVDCRDHRPGKIVAWFAGAPLAQRDARLRSTAAVAGQRQEGPEQPGRAGGAEGGPHG